MVVLWQEQKIQRHQNCCTHPVECGIFYGSACARKLEVQHSLEQVMHSYGFRNVQTPTFEYFDIFNKERGTAASNEMFKFFDRGNNTLVLRPDMTPAIARCVAKYFREETEQMRFATRHRLLSVPDNTRVNYRK